VRVALVFLAALTTVGALFATSAVAAPPVVVATASATVGVAPFAVVLSASGDAATYSWDFGDGTSGEGASVRHVYPAGRFVAVVTATAETGEIAQAQVALLVHERTVTLSAPRAADHDSAISLRGVLRPAVPGGRVQIYRGRTYVTSARVAASGRFRATVRLRAPGPYHARYGTTRSAERLVSVRPRLITSLAPAASLGSRLTTAVRLVPPSAGTVHVEVRRGGKIVARGSGRGAVRVRVPTGDAGNVRVLVTSTPARGFAAARRVLSASVVQPSLGVGSSGPSVLALERRLAELRFALRGVDSTYATDTFEAVLAFQKLHGLARTGRVDAALWGRLATAAVPRPRYPGGTRIEVDKTRQLLFEIQRGEVKRVVHVSTGATGNTPLGTWHVYRKVTGFDWVLWYPMYFLRGFAIHGYPSVPAYPASHGCVRVPMWIAPVLYAGHAYGATITVYV
jgi:PKD domain/L,D-transpeptidase catalytic domain/Putative peptidoglycan binding domain